MACINERDYEARRDCRLNMCPYSEEKAVGGFHTDKYCEGHSNCREYAMGSCDDRNNRCHYGSWQGGAEAAVGKTDNSDCYRYNDSWKSCARRADCAFVTISGRGYCRGKDSLTEEESAVASKAEMCRPLDALACESSGCSWSGYDYFCYPYAEAAVGCMACINERDYEARRDCRLNMCPYSEEKAVGGFHTDKYCEGHSNCREYAMGSCDDRNNRCHYGSWQGGAEAAVGKTDN